MADVKTLVDDALLRELSAETRKIGTKVVVRRSSQSAAYTADIADIIIVPHAEFYRAKFMVFYQRCDQNSVKALKELNKQFPFTPDYNLGIGYILNVQLPGGTTSDIRLRSEFDVLQGGDEPFLFQQPEIVTRQTKEES